MAGLGRAHGRWWLSAGGRGGAGDLGCYEPPELLEQARHAADSVDRSLSSWIRLVVEHELRRSA
jgi:hypothetical protein